MQIVHAVEILPFIYARRKTLFVLAWVAALYAFAATVLAAAPPDLIPVEIKLVRDGNVNNFEITVKNQGESSAGAFVVHVQDDKGAAIGWDSLPALKPGESGKVFTSGHRYPRMVRDGLRKITVRVDKHNAVKESDEKNNVREFLVEVKQADVRPEVPAVDADWFRAHHGEMFYLEPNLNGKVGFSMKEQAKLAKKIGAPFVKTFLKGPHPGVISKDIANKHYKYILDQFDTVCLNVCPDYALWTWDKRGEYTKESREAVRKDFRELCEHLLQKYSAKNKTFLLSVHVEMNHYMATDASKRRNFPVVQFINDALDEINAAQKRWNGKSQAKLFSVVEIVAWSDWEFFAKEYFPKVKPDLYSLSCYTPWKDIGDYIDVMRKFANPSETFGRDNFMLGEYGMTMEEAGFDEREQLDYFQRVIASAQKQRLQFMFQCWLVDLQYKINVEGHYGIWTMKSEKGGRPRLAFTEFAKWYAKK